MKISIIIPTYNRPEYLRQTINSALSQIYKDKEIIIVDDGSEMNLSGIVKGLPVKYYRKENGGVSTAMNFGIEKATGEIITTIHDDDLFYDMFSLRERMLPFIKNNNVEMIFTAVEEINKNGGKIKDYYPKQVSVKQMWIGDQEIYMPAMAWRKSIHEKIGMFSEDLISSEDYEFKLKCLIECQWMGLPEITLKYRRHGGNKSTINASKMGMYEKILKDRLKERYKEFL